MVDLVLDYSLLHELAVSVTTLRGQIETDVSHFSGRSIVGSAGAVGPDVVGNKTLYGALSGFYAVCHKPFHDAMGKLDDLAKTLDGVAKAFFDVDADFAGKANTERLQAQTSQWQADKEAHDKYEKLKNETVTYHYYDKDGHLQTATIPLWDPNSPPPPLPGATPTSITSDSGAGQTTTHSQVDGSGKIISETSTTTTPDGLSYTETTTYTYTDTNGDGKPDLVDYSTSITHSDGTAETLAKTSHTDGSYVMTDTTSSGTSTTTVTPKAGTDGYTSVTHDAKGDTTTVDVTANSDGTGTKTVTGPDGTDTYTGNPKTDQWTKSSHTDAPPVKSNQWQPPSNFHHG
jgi:hypothetical protein